MRLSIVLTITFVTLFQTASAQATEGGGSTYGHGVGNFLVAAVPPPPGVFSLGYGTFYHADRLRDGDGDIVPIPGFDLTAHALSPRLIVNSDAEILGGNLVYHALVPLMDVTVKAGGQRQSRQGMGDITFGAGLAYHPRPNLHSAVALDVVAPTGRYRAGDLANLGRNYWSLQPLFAMSLVNDEGINADFKAVLNINQRNPDTDYRSGTEFIVDYALGWGFGNGWVAGVGGSLGEQFGDDEWAGNALPNSKSRVFALGPSVKYQNKEGWFFTAKWQKEMAVRNRPDGSAFWLVTILPF